MLMCLLNATKMNLLVKEVTDSINCIVLTSERTNLVRLLFQIDSKQSKAVTIHEYHRDLEPTEKLIETNETRDI